MPSATVNQSGPDIDQGALRVAVERLCDAAQNKVASDGLREGLANYLAAVRLMPKHPRALLGVGSSLHRLHESEKALPFILSAIEQNPAAELSWRIAIDVSMAAGNVETAKALTKRAHEVGCSKNFSEYARRKLLTPTETLREGRLFKADNGSYLDFLRALHTRRFSGYLEIGTRTGSSLKYSCSPSVAIDPFFQISDDVIGEKDFCLLVQQKSEDFFTSKLSKSFEFDCEVAFIDGMHLFEFALKDFFGAHKLSNTQCLFLFHDPLPWSIRMSTRDNSTIGKQEAWVGDIWKLPFIFAEFGMKENIKLLTSGPSGLLAVFNVDHAKVAVLESAYDDVVGRWQDVPFTNETAQHMYDLGIFQTPERYLRFVRDAGLGVPFDENKKQWVSQ